MTNRRDNNSGKDSIVFSNLKLAQPDSAGEPNKPSMTIELADIKEAWEQMVVKGLTPSHPIRPEILYSWQRCRNMGLDPYRPKKPPTLDTTELSRRLDANRLFVETAKPLMDMVELSTRGTRFITALSDCDGYVMAISGDNETLEMARKNYYLPGCNRSEATAGTNAIALALIEDKPFQLVGAEHYNFYHHPWTCSSAPIHDADGKLIGAFTLSGPSRGLHKHTLAIAVSAAKTIEGHLRERILTQEKHRLNFLLTSIFDSVSDGVIAVNEDLTIANLNRSASNMLGLELAAVAGKPLNKVITFDGKLTKALKEKRLFRNQEITFKSPTGINAYLCSLNRIVERGVPGQSALITLTEKKNVIDIVKRMGGNHAKYEFSDIKGGNAELLRQIKVAKIAASANSRILISGESGTGKELFAQAIHNYSQRHDGPFVAISCAAIPRDLIEAELFGYREGAFTGARKGGQVGKFELAHCGTLFLDEINGMPLDLQAKLLRVLQQKEIVRLGDNRNIPVDVRVISACNSDLLQQVEMGDFREDLYYRLNVMEIKLPPLRERLDDLPILIDHFMGGYGNGDEKDTSTISQEVMQVFHNHDWPGNIRELENCLERALMLSCGFEITCDHLPERMIQRPDECKKPGTLTVKDNLRDLILKALDNNNGNISQAARELNISRSTMYRRIREFNLNP
jgi:sigma-54 dependent transcriptional regulator, acetoin dehydrogenase operon transcriptional activator AcoR